MFYHAVMGLSWWLSGEESAYQVGNVSSVPGSRRSSGEGNGNPLQYACLGNPTLKMYTGCYPGGNQCVSSTNTIWFCQRMLSAPAGIWLKWAFSAFRHVLDIIHPTSKFLCYSWVFTVLQLSRLKKFFFTINNILSLLPSFTSLIYEPTVAYFLLIYYYETHTLVWPTSLPLSSILSWP